MPAPAVVLGDKARERRGARHSELHDGLFGRPGKSVCSQTADSADGAGAGGIKRERGAQKFCERRVECAWMGATQACWASNLTAGQQQPLTRGQQGRCGKNSSAASAQQKKADPVGLAPHEVKADSCRALENATPFERLFFAAPSYDPCCLCQSKTMGCEGSTDLGPQPPHDSLTRTT